MSLRELTDTERELCNAQMWQAAFRLRPWLKDVRKIERFSNPPPGSSVAFAEVIHVALGVSTVSVGDVIWFAAALINMGADIEVEGLSGQPRARIPESAVVVRFLK